MNFEPGFFMLALVFSAIGYVYFQYGRKQARIPMLITGIILMVYPYFLESKLWLVTIGLVLAALPRFI